MASNRSTSSMQRPPQAQTPPAGSRRPPAKGKRPPKKSSGLMEYLPFVIAAVTVLAIGVAIIAARSGTGKSQDATIVTQQTMSPVLNAAVPTPVPTTDPASADAEPEGQAASEPAADPETGVEAETQASDGQEIAADAAPEATKIPLREAVVDYEILEGIPQTDRPLGLAQCSKVDDSYFDDAVFIGDSVTLKLNYFVRDYRSSKYPALLGNAQFLTAGSLGSGNALQAVTDKSLHPSYQGQKMALEDSVAAMGAKKVFIMLGMNDIVIYGVNGSAKNLLQLASRIKEKSPDCQIFIQSATPRIKGNYQKLNNNALFEYDLLLYNYCQQYADYGIYFVDIAYVMRDEEGNLPLNYCSDQKGQGIHFTDTACKEWIRYLYTHALVGN